MKPLDWRENSLATGLAALIPHTSCANQDSYYEVWPAARKPLTPEELPCYPGYAALWRLISFPLLTGGQGAASHRVGSPAVLTDELMESWLPASPLPGREWESAFSLQGGQTETSHPHLLHYRAKRLLCYANDIIVLLSQLGWHQFESLPDHKVCNCKMYFQQGAFSIISDIKDKKHEAGAEVEFKVMDERNVLIVGLCQLWP